MHSCQGVSISVCVCVCVVCGFACVSPSLGERCTHSDVMGADLSPSRRQVWPLAYWEERRRERNHGEGKKDGGDQEGGRRQGWRGEGELIAGGRVCHSGRIYCGSWRLRSSTLLFSTLTPTIRSQGHERTKTINDEDINRPDILNTSWSGQWL